jgi:hypothetical protein
MISTGTIANRRALKERRRNCGNETEVLGISLRSGVTRSCGCLQVEVQRQLAPLRTPFATKVNTTHGHTIGGRYTPTYTSWEGIRQRCLTSSNIKFAIYGGAGITVCDRWLNSFENFLEDMGERPEGTALSRFGDIGNYEPGNCAWHTWAEQVADAKKKKMAAVAIAA